MRAWRALKGIALSGLAALLVAAAACSASHPVTYDALAQAYRAAHESKSIGGVGRLICWGEMPEQEQTRIRKGIEETFELTISLAEIRALPPDFEMERGGYVYPFKPEKVLKVEYANPGGRGGALVGTEYTIGMKDGKAWILYRTENAPAK